MQIKPDVEPLFPYQEKTTQFIVGGKSGFAAPGVTIVASSPGRGILYIDPGLGKSRIAIESIVRLCPNAKIFILCSKKALNTWRREWPKWTDIDPKQVTIVEGQKAKRRKLWARDTQIYVATFQSAQNDWPDLDHRGKHAFQVCVADECKLWRNRKTKSYQFWAPILHKIPYVIPMDGTIVSRGPQDLWTFLNIIKPKTFSSFWKFANAFCLIVDGPFGKEFCGPKNTKGLGNMLAHKLVRIKDNDPEVKDQRPPLTRDFKLVEMTSEQKNLYDQMSEDLLVVTPSGEVIAAPSTLAMSVRHRQILICPKILDPTLGYGAAIEHLMLEMEDDPHIVIFTPYAKALPFLSEAIQSSGHPEPYKMQGGTKSETVGLIEREFNNDVGRERSVICTIGFAESYELWSTRQVFFLGYDWSQLTNYQAEKRAHRIITPHPINSWYYRYLGTVDDSILDVLNVKQHRTNITFQDYISAVSNTKNN